MPSPAALVFFLGLFGLWAWMIVDCAMFESGRLTRIAWLVVLVPVGPLAAVVYYLVRALPRALSDSRDEENVESRKVA